MTPYTRDQLADMPNRELDAVVAEVVMGVEARKPKRCPHTGAVHHLETVIRPDLPFYSTSWAAFGHVVERMRELKFSVDMTQFAGDEAFAAVFADLGSQRVAEIVAPTLPRATAIAAVLAVQGSR